MCTMQSEFYGNVSYHTKIQQESKQAPAAADDNDEDEDDNDYEDIPEDETSCHIKEENTNIQAQAKDPDAKVKSVSKTQQIGLSCIILMTYFITLGILLFLGYLKCTILSDEIQHLREELNILKHNDSTQVYFYSSFPDIVEGRVDPVKYSQVLLNIGNAYSPETGKFTCPVSGIYQFVYSATTGRKGQTDIWLMVDGIRQITNHADLPDHTISSFSVMILELRKDNSVWIMQERGLTWATSSSHTLSFGGMLLAQR
ncbi:multimerin-1 isoform X2 [Amia ocellicauda]|uniref:multimerin-1 isoform X2 n=1 Tax=Amia ocellicauda TaxID=2972642 RepID=UPI003464668E